MFWLVVYLQSYETYYFVSWDHEITNIWEKNKSNVPNHQANILLFQLLTIINHRLTID